MDLGMSPENLARALRILEQPRTAADFWRAYRPDDASEAPGTLSKRGHPPLYSLVRRGLVQRSDNGSAATDTFQTIDAIDAPQPAPLPVVPPELHVAPNGEVVEVQRRTVGRVASTPEQPASGELIVDAEGNVVRVVREVLGRVQLPQSAPATPTLEQAPPQQVPISEVQAIQSLLMDLTHLQLDAPTRYRKLEEVRARLLVNAQRTAPEGYYEVMVAQKQIFDRLCAQPTVAQPPPQPAVQAPPPSVDPIAMMQGILQLFQKMQEQVTAMQAMAQPEPEPQPHRAPYRPGPAYSPPPPPKTAAQQWREAITVVRTAVAAREEIETILPGGPEPEAQEPVEDDSPVRVMAVGDYKLVIDQRGGSRRLETVVANLGPVLRWVGEQREASQRHREVAQLPPAYVEPPPVEVPQQAAPPVAEALPVDMPHANGAPPQRRTWGMPDVSWARVA